MKTHIQRLALPVEYEKKKEVLNAAILAFIISIILFIASAIIGFFDMGRAAYAVFVGGLCYELYFLLMVFNLTENKIKDIKNKKFKSAADLVGKLFYGLIFLTIIAFLLINKPTGDNRLSLVLALIIIVIPVLAWNKLFKGFQKMSKKWFIFPLLLLILLAPVYASFEDIQEGINVLAKTVEFLSKIYAGVLKIYHFFTGLSANISSILNISSTISSIITIIIVLVAIYVLLKLLRIIIKWAILALIIWVILQILGIL